MSSRVQVPVAAHEVLRELEEITRRAASPNREAAKGDLDQGSQIGGCVAKRVAYRQDAVHFGCRYGELGEFEEAIGYYRRRSRRPERTRRSPSELSSSWRIFRRVMPTNCTGEHMPARS